MKIDSQANNSNGARVAHGLGAAVGTFFVATVAMAVGIYVGGGEDLAQRSAGADEFALFELTSSAAFSVASAVMSLIFGLVGFVTAAGAAVIGLAVGALGIAGAVVVTVGMVTGPVLILLAAGLLVKRRFFPDVI
jgi:hypothetical protein